MINNQPQDQARPARRRPAPSRTNHARVRIVTPNGGVVSANRTSARRGERSHPRRATFELGAPQVVINPWPTARAWKASRPQVAAFFLTLLVLGLLYQLFNADLFFVYQLSVNGNRIVPSAEIEQRAGIQGWNIFFVEPGQVAARLQALPEFKSVEVSVELPAAVVINVEERQPVFVWEAGAKNYWVDANGIALQARGAITSGILVRDATGTAIPYGERVNADAFNAVVSLLNTWQDVYGQAQAQPGAAQAAPVKPPQYFEWTRQHGLTMREEHGWVVYMGSANQMADKLAALRIVQDQLQRDKSVPVFIDLGSGLPYYQVVAAKTK